MEQLMPLPQPQHPPVSATQADLRDLYRRARTIHFTDDCAAARLARLADQAEYFLHQWPADQWPATLHSPHLLPPQDVLLAWLANVKREAGYYRPPFGCAWTYGAWRQISTTLLAALVPFG